MNSTKRSPADRYRARHSHLSRLTVAFLVLGLAACSRGPGQSDPEVYVPPPPLALVTIVDPSSGRMADELHALEDVIRSNATPSEAVVVMLLQAGVTRTYVVRPGDNLSSIANANGLTLAGVEAANPQFGPLSGRNWKLIHPGERVTLLDSAAPDPLALVTRAPAGPPPPTLARPPQPPQNPTDFQRAEYIHLVAADNATNATRVAAWRAEAAKKLQPWQQHVVDELDRKAASPLLGASSANGPMLSASITAGVTTLRGLPGRHLLLLLGGGEIGPAALTAGSLIDINLVIANLSDSATAAAWTAAGRDAGAASVGTLDPALTQLQLAQVVNG